MRSSQGAFVSCVGRAAVVRHTALLSALAARRSFCSSSFLASRGKLSVGARGSAAWERACTGVGVRSAPVASVPQQEADWNDVQVLEVTRPCEAHTLLTLNVGVTFDVGSMCDSYRVPGMFVQLRPSSDVKPAFVAISSPPTISGVFEFLVKDSDASSWIPSLREGDVIHSSPVMGKGFPIASLLPPPPDVLLFATGSGIAPIRAAIESVLNGVNPGKRRSVTLFYGARTPERMPYTDRFDEWKQVGVHVVPVISRPDSAAEPWDGYTGYVQHALDEVGVEDPPNTAALLCGVRGMTEDVRKRLVAAGVPDGNILLNF